MNLQRGVVLLITLIVLVAMTLTAIALARSAHTTNLIAGNLVFQQSASHSAERGAMIALKWLQENAASNTLNSEHHEIGYSEIYDNPSPGQNWDNYFNTNLSGRTLELPADETGNVVTYAIERLCRSHGIGGNPSGCTVTPNTNTSHGNSLGIGNIGLNASSQLYYRITARSEGPHHSKSYVQIIVAL